MSYLGEIVACRHFWAHLARAEVRARFRRSRLGVAWALLQPLLLTLLLAVVFGGIFRLPIRDFALFVYSGLVVWDFIALSVVNGCGSLLTAEPYIKLRRLPVVIYPLRVVLGIATVSMVAFAGLILWVIIDRPEVLGLPLVGLPPAFALICLLGWGLAIHSAFINARFRDFQQFVGVILQAVWYVSPVFIEPRLFTAAGLEAVLFYNPITHVLNLIREPLLWGQFPSGVDWAFAAGFAALVWLFAVARVRRSERDIVFYL